MKVANNILELLEGAAKSQGKVTIGGVDAVDKMNETMILLKTTIKQTLTQVFVLQGMDAGQAELMAQTAVDDAPIIRSSAGGVGIVIPNGNSYALINITGIIAEATSSDQAEIEAATNKLFEGDYLDFHYLGMDILLEYFH